MGKYRKKPVVIEATHENYYNAFEALGWWMDLGRKKDDS